MDATSPVPPPLAPLPFEFTVAGRPVSHQSGNRALLAKCRKSVTTAAATDWAAMPLTGNLRIAVTYYHEEAVVRLDGDDMLKPIQDALIGLLFVDDGQITDAEVRKSPIDGPIRARYGSRPLLEAFAVGQPFVHVIIDTAPSHADPLRRTT